MTDYTSEPIEDFKLTIDALKMITKQRGHEVSNTEIAEQLDISVAQLEKYYNSNVVSNDIYSLLREKYSDFLSGFRIERVRFTVELEVEDPYVPPPGEDKEDQV